MDMLVPPLSWQKKRFSAQDAVKHIFSFYEKDVGTNHGA